MQLFENQPNRKLWGGRKIKQGMGHPSWRWQGRSDTLLDVLQAGELSHIASAAFDMTALLELIKY